MTIENHGYSSFDTNPFYFSAIVDNVKYDPAFVTSLTNELQAVSVLDKGVTKGQVAFEVPAGASNIAIQYNGFGGQNIRWVKQ